MNWYSYLIKRINGERGLTDSLCVFEIDFCVTKSTIAHVYIGLLSHT